MTKTKTIIENVVDKIYCNKCGRELKTSINNEKTMEIEEYHHYESIGGYFSKIGDMIRFEFDLCDDCIWEYMKTFAIPPKFEDYECKEIDIQEKFEKRLYK